MDGRGWTSRIEPPSRSGNPIEAAITDERIRLKSAAMDGRGWTSRTGLSPRSGNPVEAAFTDERIR